MRIRTFGAVRIALVALALGACSSSEITDDDTDPLAPTGEFFLRANIDGAWAAEGFFAALVAPGVYTMSGSKAIGPNPYLISLSLYNIGGPETYPLGTGSTVPGGAVVVSTIQGGWASPMSGADGSITITTLTPTRIAGTFSFTVSAQSGGTSGTKTATNGEFVLPLRSDATTVQIPDNFGSKVSATVAGVSWNAANASGSYSAGNRVATITANNNARFINITLNEVTGPGTYPLSSTGRVMSSSATTQTLSNSWSSAGAGSSGSVIITSLTTTRMKGTFSATLGPTPGASTTGTLTIASGSFDIGLGAPPE